MFWIKPLRVTLLALVICLFSLPVAAQSELEGMSFDELIGEAKTAYEAEQFDDAIKYLLAANRAQPNARLLLNVAKSYERSDQCVKALVYFRAFVRDPEAEVVLIEQAREVMSKSSECEGWNDLMSGRLMLSASEPGASATIDGKSVGTLPTEVVGLLEGDHTIVITLDGYQTFEETLKLYPDKDATIHARLREKPPEIVVDTIAPPSASPRGPAPIAQYLIATGLTVTGVTLITIGLITDLGIPGKYDDPREEPGISLAEFATLTEQRKGAVTRALVFYVVGGVLTAGGAGYGAYVTSNASKKESAPSVSLSPEFGRDGIGFSLSGTF